MTVEEIKALKSDAENAILKILSELQTATKCKTTYVNVDQVDAGTKDTGTFMIMTNVSIVLEIP